MKSDLIKSERHLRLLVFAAFFMMFAHCALLVLGIELHIAEILCICFGFYLVHRFAFHFFKFCKLTRLAIYYDYIMFLCIWVERYIGFGELRNDLRIAMLIIGAVLSVCIITKFSKTICK